MHGPYRAQVQIDGEALSLAADDVVEGEHVADRFYQAAGRGTLDGFTRAAVFTTGLLLDPGQEARVEIVGRDGPESGSIRCEASSYRGDHAGCSMCDGSGRRRVREIVRYSHRVRRDDRGRLVSTLGSRFNERVFNGA